MNALSIRRGAPGDLDRLVEIEQAAFETDRMSRRSFAHSIASASSCCLVAEAKGRVVGYALVNFRKNSRKARLFSLARADDAPRGCGRALLAGAESAAHDRGCVVLRLEVRETNTRAIALYEIAGFRCFGRHAEYYEDGAPALRFEKALATLPDRRV